MTLTVAPVDRKAAGYAVLNWHYSHRLPMGRLVNFGVWENDRYIGVVMFARGASPGLGNAYGLTQMQLCELARVALRDHQAPVSQVVSAAVEQLKVSSPGLRAIVSFADPYQGHHGGIYQAMNWLYLGTSNPTAMWKAPNGQVLHTRTVAAGGYVKQFGKMTKVERRDACERIEVPGKHRYVLPLDRAMRRQLAPLARPYPARVAGAHAVEVSTGDDSLPSS